MIWPTTSLISSPVFLALANSALATMFSFQFSEWSRVVLPQGLCTCCSLSLERSYLGLPHGLLFASFVCQSEYHLLREASPDVNTPPNHALPQHPF